MKRALGKLDLTFSYRCAIARSVQNLDISISAPFLLAAYTGRPRP
jgi:hypothetical protein